MPKTFRKTRAYLILSILGVLLLCTLICACNRKDNDKYLPACYELTLDLDGDTLDAYQEILYVAPESADCIVLNVYANAFLKNSVKIESAQVNRINADFEIYGDDNTLLKLLYSPSRGQHLNISFKYTVTVPLANERLGRTTRGVTNLACFYPVIAKYDNGWREDGYCKIGDPFYHDTASFYCSLTVDADAEVACSGKITDAVPSLENGKDKKTLEIEAENIRDFAITLGKMYKLTDAVEIDGKKTDIKYCYFFDPYPSRTVDRIKSALTAFSEAFGNYPYDTFTVAQSMLDGAGGMEYGSFAVVSLCDSVEVYYDAVTHETAHQWWYGAVGNDQINSAWLDEGLAEFSTYYYHYLTDDAEKFTEAMAGVKRSYSAFADHKNNVGFNGKMDRPLSTYLTDGEYSAVAYMKGAMLFETLRNIAGDRRFQQAMKRYCADNMMKIATATSLAEAFLAEGVDVSATLNAWISDLAPSF